MCMSLDYDGLIKILMIYFYNIFDIKGRVWCCRNAHQPTLSIRYSFNIFNLIIPKQILQKYLWIEISESGGNIDPPFWVRRFLGRPPQ